MLGPARVSLRSHLHEHGETLLIGWTHRAQTCSNLFRWAHFKLAPVAREEADLEPKNNEKESVLGRRRALEHLCECLVAASSLSEFLNERAAL